MSPSQGPLPAHLIEGSGPGAGRGGGVPGGEASVCLQEPFTCWRGVGPGASMRDGAGLEWWSRRGHPTAAAAEQTGPLSLSPGGGAARRPTGTSANRSCGLTCPS